MDVEKFYHYKCLNRQMLDGLDKYVKKSNWKKHNFHQPNWVITQKNNQNDDDKLYSQFRGILNKISDSNLKELSDEIISLNITKKEQLVNLVDVIFTKAISESKFCTVYSKLSKHLASYYIEENNTKIYFRKILINKCQTMFSEAISLDEELSNDSDNQCFKFKNQIIGCITYIGELYNQELLTHQIISSCFDLIFVKVSLKKAYIMEIMCTFMSVVHDKFSKECSEEFETRVGLIKNIKDSSDISIKDKFAIMDVLDKL